MNVRKSWLTTFALCGLFAFSSFANAPIFPKTTSINKQFTKLLKDINLDDLKTDLTVYVDFIINDRGEIMVLSTSGNKFDSAIKSKLNYKTVEAGELEYGKKYTIPVSFKK